MSSIRGVFYITIEDSEKTVLIVEDDKLIRKYLKIALSRRNFNIILANNGEEALEKWKDKSNNIDLIILDLHIPGIDGFEFLEIISNSNIDQELPKVIISTGSSDYETIHQIEKYPIQGIITKPFTIEELYSSIDLAFSE